ncbi:MAG: gliding motility-associated C-terminal domain-containing protein, partial [Cyclobacteriaceae bacterium]|nr:gliding motility-associated C-terminal domain-containing protein [Cyclobacteriaceae bacterium]
TSATVDFPAYCDDAIPVNITLTAVGDSLGTGATAECYTDARFTTSAGSGSPLMLAAPGATTTYYVRYESGCGNTPEQSITVTVDDPSVAPTSATVDFPAYCDDAIPVNITLTALGGSLGTGATVEWYTDAAFTTSAGSGNPLVLAGPGTTTTYYVRYEGTCGNTTGQNVTVTVDNASVGPTSATVDNNNYCSDAAPANITLTAVGGSLGTGATIEWYMDATFTTSAGSGSPLMLVAPGATTTYYVRYESGCGNTPEQSITVTVPQAPNAGTANPQTTCPSDNAFDLFIGLTGNDSGGTWNDDNGTGQLSGSIFNAAALSIATITTFNFTYTVTGIAPCGNDMVTLQVTVDPAAATTPPNGGTDIAQDVCQDGGQPDLMANTLAGATVKWYSDAGLTDLLYNDAGTGVPFTPNSTQLDVSIVSPPTTQFFVTQETSCGESSPIIFTASVIAKPDAGTDFTTGICESDAAVSLNAFITDLGGDTGGTWVWSNDNLTGAFTGAPSDPSFDPGVSGDGAFTFDYTVDGTGVCTGSSATATLTINVDPGPAEQTIQGGDQTICEGETVTITLDNAEADVTYTLFVDGTDSGISNSSSSATADFPIGDLGQTEGLVAGSSYNITVEATASGGCKVILADFITVTVQNLPIDQTISEANTSAQTICEVAGQTVTLDASENGVEYEILLNGSPISPTPIKQVGDGNAPFFIGNLTSAEGLVAGNNYIITVTATSSTCITTLSGQIEVDVQTVSNPPLDNNGSSPVGACQNGAAPVISVLGSNVKWYSDASLTTEVKPGSGSSLDTDGLVDTSVTGPTSFFATQDEGCGESTALEIIVSVENCSGCFTVDIAKTDATCSDDDGSIKLTAGTMGVSPFDYEITDTSDGSKVTQNDQPNNSFTFNDLHSGTYNYVVRDNTGCEVTGSVDVSFKETEVTATVTKVGDFACFGDPTGGTARITVVGGTSPVYQYKVGSGDWTDFVSGNIVSGLPVGENYSILIRDDASDLCPYKDSISITEPAAITGFVNSVSPSFNEQDVGVIYVSGISSDYPPYTVYLEDLSGTLIDFGKAERQNSVDTTLHQYTFDHLPVGEYIVYVSDSSGCVRALQSTVIELRTDVVIPNVFTPNNDGVNEAFIILNKKSNTKIVIANRWGVEVYKSDDYQNDWRAEGLPDGIYFYTLSMEGEVYKGPVEVWRGRAKINN